VHPGRKVVTVNGDGGILMNFQELETARRLRTPFVNVVWENRQFGSIVWKQDRKFGEHFGVDFTNPDFVKLAEAFGLPAWRCEKPDDFARHLQHALTLDVPSLIVVPIDYSADVAFAQALGDEAKLTERYFYEAFPEGGRDALLRAVHDKVAAQAREAIVAAVAAAAGGAPESVALAAVSGFTAFLEEDPRRGRVLVSESFHESVLARHDIELVPAFAALLVAQIRALPDAPDDTDAELTAVALLGALRAIYLAWLGGTPAISTQRLNAHAARLVIAAARVSSRDVHD
jgi:hypothetical protein